MSNIKESLLLSMVVLVGFFSTTTGQVTCVSPIEIGELRVMNSKACVDIAGDTGSGDVHTYKCDGKDDQQIILCSDGTIRNEKANYCFSAGINGDGNVESTFCEVYPDIPNYQKWRFGSSRTFTDNGGIEQMGREIINVKSGLCLDVSGRDGTGDIGTYRCQGMDDQYFFIRSRGKVLAHGRLQVQKSGLCVDVSGKNGGAGFEKNGVQIWNCEDAADQTFRLYENGELVNDKSKLCLDVSGNSGSENVLIYACEDAKDQMWTQPHQYCDGDYCSFINAKSEDCLDVSGSEAQVGANILTYKCEGLADQRFKWVSRNWVTPTAEWNMVGCNQNGDVTQQIVNTISYSSTMSKTTTMEISSTIEAGFEFGSVSVTASVAESLSKEWENSQSQTQSITFTCKNYDNNDPFIRGCMWQLTIKTRSAEIGGSSETLDWSPQIIKCTSSSVEPKCPPFTRCLDKGCTKCEKMPGSWRKKR